jgi:hypothetical protein
MASALAIAIGLAACGELPKPFAHQGPVDAPLLRLGDSAGVVVRAPTGLPPEAAERLAQGLATALQDANVPASVDGGNHRSYHLGGRATVWESDGRIEEVSVFWRLYDGRGAWVGQVAQRYDVTGAAGPRFEPETIEGVARAAAPRIAALIQDRPVVEAKPLSVFVAAVNGAPGDGNEALRRALEAFLAQQSVPVAAAASDGNTLTVEGKVAVGEPEAGAQRVQISWRILDPRGEERGVVDQANTIPSGSLSGPWGDMAYAVADAASSGIFEIIEQVKLQRAQAVP